jgi:FMN phosphatase YigB (HAD superfamily)
MKNKLKIICFDLDNVICKTNSKHNYKKSKPILKAINFINKLYNAGYEIKIYTARYMGRHKENINFINKNYFEKTKKQLNKWNLKYHKLYMGKPNFDIFIDDKSLNFSKNWIKNLNKKVNHI